MPADPARPIRFPGLDGTRALGAIMVMTTHVGFYSGDALNGPFNGILSRLDSGVAIFFVISGFLLARPHFTSWFARTERPAAGTYFWHRALRILPALWIAVLACWFLLPRADHAWEPYVRHATLTQIYSRGNETSGLTQMWSLATEVAFYLLLPALGWLMTRGPRSRRALILRIGALATTPVLGATWMAWSAATGHPLSALWLPGFLGWFGLGMLIALWGAAASAGLAPSSRLRSIARHRGTVWALAGAVYLVATSAIAGPYSLKSPTPGEAATKSLLYAIFAFLVVLPSAIERPQVPRKTPSGVALSRATSLLGDTSYGIFCYHLIVLALVERATGQQVFHGGFITLWSWTFVLTVAIAALSFYAVERPIMRRGRRVRLGTRKGGDRSGRVAKATASTTIA